MKKKLVIFMMILLSLTLVLSACNGNAKDKVSYNISRDADEFRVIRRVVF